MRYNTLLNTFLCFILVTPLYAAKVNWSYKSTDKWGNLSAEYARCAEGKRQSPIDIPVKQVVSAQIKPFEIEYGKGYLNATYDGHAVKVIPGAKNYLNFLGVKSKLIQFHFHTPSEYKVAGKSYPAVIHFVHQDVKGQLSVLGVFIKVGKTNPILDAILSHTVKEGSSDLQPRIDGYLTELLPKNLSQFYYLKGSLTTPPCSENVNWIVLKNPITASVSQISKLQEIMPHTNRPIQPRNGRIILQNM